MAENISNLENAKDFDEIVTPSPELIESFKHMLKDIGEDETRDGLLCANITCFLSTVGVMLPTSQRVRF